MLLAVVAAALAAAAVVKVFQLTKSRPKRIQNTSKWFDIIQNSLNHVTTVRNLILNLSMPSMK